MFLPIDPRRTGNSIPNPFPTLPPMPPVPSGTGVARPPGPPPTFAAVSSRPSGPSIPSMPVFHASHRPIQSPPSPRRTPPSSVPYQRPVIPTIGKSNATTVQPCATKLHLPLVTQLELPTIQTFEQTYGGQSNELLRRVAVQRGIGVPRFQVAEALYEYDMVVCPDEKIEMFREMNLQRLQDSPLSTVVTFGVHHGVKYCDSISRMRDRCISQYTQLMFLINNNRQDEITNMIAPNDVNPDVIRLIYTKLTQNIISEELRRVRLEVLQPQQLYHHISRNSYTLTAKQDRWVRRLLPVAFKVNTPYILDLHEVDTLSVVGMLSVHPLEEVIISATVDNVNSLIAKYQVMVPTTHVSPRERLEYFLETMASYRLVPLDRSKSPIAPGRRGTMSLRRWLNTLTDLQILRECGAYVYFDDRENLIDRVISLYSTPEFHSPLHRVHPTQRETISGSLITDTSVFVVAYGTVTDKVYYEIDDLLGAFHVDSDTGVFAFRKPDTPSRVFSMQSVGNLLALLQSYGDVPIFHPLITRIMEGIAYENSKGEYDETLRSQVGQLPPGEREMIKKHLRSVFHIGMLMRRWKGEGHPYPIRSKDTEININPEPAVVEYQHHMDQQITRYPARVKTLLDNIRLVKYVGDRVETMTKTLDTMISDVVHGRYCIRMASSVLVSTACHYLDVVMRDPIVGVDARRIEFIM